MEKFKSPMKKAALVFALLGLAGFIAVILSKSAYPDPLFVWGSRIAMAVIFISLGLYAVYWFMELVELVKKEEWGLVAGHLLLGALVCFLILRKIR